MPSTRRTFVPFWDTEDATPSLNLITLLFNLIFPQANLNLDVGQKQAALAMAT
jgi:hypothetical protein